MRDNSVAQLPEPHQPVDSPAAPPRRNWRRELEDKRDRLVAAVPALAELREWSASVRVDHHIWRGCHRKECARCREGMEHLLYELVGYGRESKPGDDPWLASSEAWDFAVAVLFFKRLPRRRPGAGGAR